ncbi:MAG: CotS family spore coat protein [Clostridia bacterium]|jgi:CotS family spore coat protein|nr:CotS family spore coat protein [Clostridia bacterium]
MDFKTIEEHYGFKIRNMDQIKNIYKAETDKGVKCIKRAHMSPSYFLFMYSAVNYLHENGFVGVIPYNTCLDGSICVEEDKYIYYVVNWEESRECKFKNPEDLKAIIKTAAEFHDATIGYRIPEGAKPRIFYNRWTTKFNKKCIELLEFSKAIEEKEYMDEFDEIFAKHLTYFWNQGRESIDLLNNSAYSKISLASQALGEFCHHDMANHNFLRTPENKIYMIDFDYCIMDTRLHDVASIVIRNMRHGVWDLNKAYFILNEYGKYYPLSDEDLGVIKAFMVYPQDFWQVGLQYYVEHQPWAMDYFLLRLKRIIEDKEIREKFLKEFLAL